MYGIETKTYERMQQYFSTRLDIYKVTLFGSRAKGLEQSHSDIDLCIDYRGISRGTVVFELEEVVGIYSVDIVFEDKLSEEIARQIKRDGIIIYSREDKV